MECDEQKPRPTRSAYIAIDEDTIFVRQTRPAWFGSLFRRYLSHRPKCLISVEKKIRNVIYFLVGCTGSGRDVWSFKVSTLKKVQRDPYALVAGLPLHSSVSAIQLHSGGFLHIHRVYLYRTVKQNESHRTTSLVTFTEKRLVYCSRRRRALKSVQDSSAHNGVRRD